jgi:hypothetical protein
MHVDYSCRNMAVLPELLHRAKIVAISQKMSGEGIPEERNVPLLSGEREMR